jgi:type I site-specific restriction endonuclease
LAILDLVVGTNLNSKKTRIVKDIPKVKKAVNSNIRHASDQAVIRKIFLNKKTADLKLKELTKKISKNGFPKGTIKDTRPNRVLVPIGNNGYAVYQIGKNGTAKLNTTLIRK